MTIDEIKTVIQTALPTDCIKAESADDVHFSVTVVSEAFVGIMKMKQHQMIMELFREQIANESIHALSLKTYTPDKWAQLQAENQ
ncbi:MAG: BolA family transcriptional regulator [Gammaproteobacteria bacterium]|nr:MAG: BolA family transcriptional regulator [Gammaproteobacteria bacterium]